MYVAPSNSQNISVSRLRPVPATYSSSKAALNLFSETLRLELSPFGVTVLSILAGTVDSQFHANDTGSGTGFAVPQGSRYAPIQETSRDGPAGRPSPRAAPAGTFAEGVAGDIVGERDGLLFRGRYAGAMGVLLRWAPRAVTVSWSNCRLSVLDERMRLISSFWQDAAMSYNRDSANFRRSRLREKSECERQMLQTSIYITSIYAGTKGDDGYSPGMELR